MGEAAKKINEASLNRLLSLVKSHTGITMQERKREMLYARINRRLRVLGMDSVEQYMDHLQTKTPETQEFVNLVTTNMTQFFRTQIVWDYIQKEFLPDWFAKNPTATLRIWSAAASTGEEAHSLAMICEEFKLGHPGFQYRIFGSDISTEVLATAEAGIYAEKPIEELKTKHPTFFSKYWKHLGPDQYKASEVLTKNLEFATHNLHQRPPKQNFFDLVLLRNVMIYFDDADNELVLNQMNLAMKAGGVLILGESESLSRLKTKFKFIKPLIYRRGDT